MQSQHNILNFQVIQPHSPPLPAGCTQLCLGSKVEVYWCCCRITFEIASLFCFFFLSIFPCWYGGGVVVMVKVRLQICLVDGRVGSFCCFSLPRSLYTASVCSITSDRSGGCQKGNLFFPDVWNAIQTLQSLLILYIYMCNPVCVCVCVVKVHARTLKEQFTQQWKS